jgi:hypothetical protein
MKVFLKSVEGKNGSTYLQGYSRRMGRSVKLYIFKASGNGVDGVANVIIKGLGYGGRMRRSYSSLRSWGRKRFTRTR